MSVPTRQGLNELLSLVEDPNNTVLFPDVEPGVHRAHDDLQNMRFRNDVLPPPASIQRANVDPHPRSTTSPGPIDEERMTFQTDMLTPLSMHDRIVSNGIKELKELHSPIHTGCTSRCEDTENSLPVGGHQVRFQHGHADTSVCLERDTARQPAYEGHQNTGAMVHEGSMMAAPWASGGQKSGVQVFDPGLRCNVPAGPSSPAPRELFCLNEPHQACLSAHCGGSILYQEVTSPAFTIQWGRRLTREQLLEPPRLQLPSSTERIAGIPPQPPKVGTRCKSPSSVVAKAATGSSLLLAAANTVGMNPQSPSHQGLQRGNGLPNVHILPKQLSYGIQDTKLSMMFKLGLSDWRLAEWMENVKKVCDSDLVHVFRYTTAPLLESGEVNRHYAQWWNSFRRFAIDVGFQSVPGCKGDQNNPYLTPSEENLCRQMVEAQARKAWDIFIHRRAQLAREREPHDLVTEKNTGLDVQVSGSRIDVSATAKSVNACSSDVEFSCSDAIKQTNTFLFDQDLQIANGLSVSDLPPRDATSSYICTELGAITKMELSESEVADWNDEVKEACETKLVQFLRYITRPLEESGEVGRDYVQWWTRIRAFAIEIGAECLPGKPRSKQDGSLTEEDGNRIRRLVQVQARLAWDGMIRRKAQEMAQAERHLELTEQNVKRVRVARTSAKTGKNIRFTANDISSSIAPGIAASKRTIAYHEQRQCSGKPLTAQVAPQGTNELLHGADFPNDCLYNHPGTGNIGGPSSMHRAIVVGEQSFTNFEENASCLRVQPTATAGYRPNGYIRWTPAMLTDNPYNGMMSVSQHQVDARYIHGGPGGDYIGTGDFLGISAMDVLDSTRTSTLYSTDKSFGDLNIAHHLSNAEYNLGDLAVTPLGTRFNYGQTTMAGMSTFNPDIQEAVGVRNVHEALGPDYMATGDFVGLSKVKSMNSWMELPEHGAGEIVRNEDISQYQNNARDGLCEFAVISLEKNHDNGEKNSIDGSALNQGSEDGDGELRCEGRSCDAVVMHRESMILPSLDENGFSDSSAPPNLQDSDHKTNNGRPNCFAVAVEDPVPGTAQHSRTTSVVESPVQVGAQDNVTAGSEDEDSFWEGLLLSGNPVRDDDGLFVQ